MVGTSTRAGLSPYRARGLLCLTRRASTNFLSTVQWHYRITTQRPSAKRRVEIYCSPCGLIPRYRIASNQLSWEETPCLPAVVVAVAAAMRRPLSLRGVLHPGRVRLRLDSGVRVPHSAHRSSSRDRAAGASAT